HVQEGRLAGAVGANQADHAAALDREVDVGGSDHGAEALVDLLGHEDRAHRSLLLRRCSSDHRPLGRNMMIASIAPPSMSCQTLGAYWLASVRSASKTSDDTKGASTLPTPPRMAMKTNSPEVVQYVVSGSTWPTASAAQAPPSPASAPAARWFRYTTRQAD